MKSDLAQAVVTLLAIMNPIGAAPVFQNMVSPLPRARQQVAALWACLFITIILACAALFGREVLALFGISIDAFRAAGGIVLTLMGLSMLGGKKSEEHERLADEESIRENLLVPFAMPMVAGPGSITAVIVLASGQHAALVPWTALGAVCVGVLATAASLQLMIAFGRYISQDAQRIVTRFLGLILVAMGVQFVLVGATGIVEPMLSRSADKPATPNASSAHTARDSETIP